MLEKKKKLSVSVSYTVDKLHADAALCKRCATYMSADPRKIFRPKVTFSTKIGWYIGYKKYIFRSYGIVLRRCKVRLFDEEKKSFTKEWRILTGWNINLREYLGIFRFANIVFVISVRPACRGRTRFIRSEFNSFPRYFRLFLINTDKTLWKLLTI